MKNPFEQTPLPEQEDGTRQTESLRAKRLRSKQNKDSQSASEEPADSLARQTEEDSIEKMVDAFREKKEGKSTPAVQQEPKKVEAKLPPLFISKDTPQEQRRRIIEEAAKNPDRLGDRKQMNTFMSQLSQTELNVFHTKRGRITGQPESKLSMTPKGVKKPKREGAPLPEGGSQYRSPVIKAGRVIYQTSAGEKKEEQTTNISTLLTKKIKKEGLPAVQAEAIEVALQAVHTYATHQLASTTLAIKREALGAFIDHEENDYRKLFKTDDFVKNTRQFLSYIIQDLHLVLVPEIKEKLQMLNEVARLSPQPEKQLTEAEEIQSRSTNNE